MATTFELVIYLCVTVFPDNWSPTCAPTITPYPNVIACQSRARYYNETFPIRKHYLDDTGPAYFGTNDVAMMAPAECREVSK